MTTTPGPPSEPSAPQPPAPVLHGEIKDYRQPFVTSLGIILGFILGYLGTWANSSDGELLSDTTDLAIFVTIVLAAAVLIVALYRMLNPSIASKDPLRYYQTTLRLYVVGIVIAFGGLLIAWVI